MVQRVTATNDQGMRDLIDRMRAAHRANQDADPITRADAIVDAAIAPLTEQDNRRR